MSGSFSKALRTALMLARDLPVFLRPEASECLFQTIPCSLNFLTLYMMVAFVEILAALGKC